MKFSQMQKIYCRFRFIDINHGINLSQYFRWSSSKFDPESTRSLSEISSMNKKKHLNMIKYKVAFDPLEADNIRMIIYTISWALKILSSIILWKKIEANRIEKWEAYLIAVSQKIHLSAINLIVLDLITYSLRAIFQSKNQPIGKVVFSGILLSLFTYDIFEACYIGSNTSVQDDPFGIIQTPLNSKHDASSSKAENHPLDLSHTII